MDRACGTKFTHSQPSIRRAFTFHWVRYRDDWVISFTTFFQNMFVLKLVAARNEFPFNWNRKSFTRCRSVLPTVRTETFVVHFSFLLQTVIWLGIQITIFLFAHWCPDKLNVRWCNSICYIFAMAHILNRRTPFAAFNHDERAISLVQITSDFGLQITSSIQ